MKDKIIKIEIRNGLLMSAENVFSKAEQNGNSTISMSDSDAPFGLKEIGIVMEVMLKEQQKQINRQKDEANKSKTIDFGNLDSIQEVQEIIFKNGMILSVSKDGKALMVTDPKTDRLNLLLVRD